MRADDLERSAKCGSNRKYIKLASGQQNQELFDLVQKIQPGFFKKKTHALRDYYGIYKNEKFIAVTGERMKMNRFTEVSAVITHPEYTGRGYAQQLVYHTCRLILKQGKIPFLHTGINNHPALFLYKKLGFVSRRKISF